MFLSHDDIMLRKRFPDIGVNTHALESAQRQYKAMIKSEAGHVLRNTQRPNYSPKTHTGVFSVCKIHPYTLLCEY